jgi:hypothetical protein
MQGYDAYYGVNPEDIALVIHKGNIMLSDSELFGQLRGYLNTNNFSKVFINGCFKYIYGDLPGLMDNILSYYPDCVFPFLK